MIVSDKQQAANRQNAQHSTGPKSPEGKAAVRFNALTFGLRTRATLLPDDDLAEYSRLWDALHADWQPQDRTEMAYLETMVTSQWMLARAAESEKKVYMFIEFGEQQFKMLEYVSRRRAQLERSFRTAIEDMKKSQQERSRQQARKAQPTPAAKAAPAPAPKPAAQQAPPSDYVMSDGAEANPVSCAPITPDSR
jgi:hypothetical protein